MKTVFGVIVATLLTFVSSGVFAQESRIRLGGWTLKESMDPDGSLRVSAIIIIRHGDVPGSEWAFQFTCHDDSESFAAFYPRQDLSHAFDPDDMHEVAYRIDNNPYQRSAWVAEHSQGFLLSIETHRAVSFMRELSKGKMLLFRIHDNSARKYELRFSLAGTREVLDRMTDACNLK